MKPKLGRGVSRIMSIQCRRSIRVRPSAVRRSSRWISPPSRPVRAGGGVAPTRCRRATVRSGRRRGGIGRPGPRAILRGRVPCGCRQGSRQRHRRYRRRHPGGGLGIRHRARIGLVFKGAVAVELQLLKRMGGLGCGVAGFVSVVAGFNQRIFFLPPGLSGPRVIPRGLHGLRKSSRGRTLHPAFGARTGVEEDGGRLICFAMQRRGASPAGGNQLPPVLEGSSALTAACPSLEGRSGDGWMSCPKAQGGRSKPAGWFRSPCPTVPEQPLA